MPYEYTDSSREARENCLLFLTLPNQFVRWTIKLAKGRTKKHHDEATKPKTLSLIRRRLTNDSVRNHSAGLGAFSKLPYELRCMIYIYVLGEQLLHLDKPIGISRLAHYRCSWTRTPQEYTGFDAPRSLQTPYHCHNWFYLPNETAGNGKMGLPKTSRAVYAEAIEVLYTSNTFSIIGIQNLETFLYWHQSILPHRLASITRLYINIQIECFEPMDYMFRSSYFPRFNREWGQVWDIITTKMTGLRYVTVHLKRTYKPFLVLRLEEAWVQPMLRVRNLQGFRFELSESDNMPAWDERYKEEVRKLKLFLETSLSANTAYSDPA